MKRIISLILCLVFVMALAAPVSAAEPRIIFTEESYYEPGFTVEVDKGATLMSCYDNGTSDIYNAYLEGDVQYYWMRNDSYYADCPSITIREEDRGCQFYCMAALYSDADHTQQIGTIDSATFSVPNIIDPPTDPEITTTELPNAVVGQEYYFKLECTDPDVTYSLLRSSLPDGMYLTQHGEIEGTPTETGFWYVVIMATPEAGEVYATTAEFEFYVVKDEPEYTLEIMRLPDKLEYYQGEKLDMTGAWIRIWTPEGYLDSFDGEYLEYSTQTLVTVGEQKMRIAYKGVMDVFYIKVLENPDFGIYTVTYYLDGTIFEEMDVDHGDCAEDLLVDEVEGKSFKGWLTEDGEWYDFSAPVTGDLELYGYYGYAVVLCFGEDPIGAQVVLEGECAVEPEPPAQEGKDFLGWYTEFTGGVKFDFSTPITGNINLYARFVDGQKPVEPPFTDISEKGFYYDSVLWAVAQGITNGMGNGIFGVDEDCTRGQVVTFLWRAAGSPEPTSTENPFSDVKENGFYYKAVLWAEENGITKGMGNGTFGVEEYCTRGQVVTFLWRAAGSPEPNSRTSSFVDVKPTDFFFKSVLWAVDNGITNGVDATHFDPTTACTRAQVVTFLYRVYN